MGLLGTRGATSGAYWERLTIKVHPEQPQLDLHDFCRAVKLLWVIQLVEELAGEAEGVSLMLQVLKY